MPDAPIEPLMPCKVCGQASPLYGVVDFNKTCLESRGVRLPVSGIPVYYRRCIRCGFLFTEFCDGWTDRDFRERIYNEEYRLVDPDYAATRPDNNAQLVARLFGEHRGQISVLDYGGGDGLLAARLREHGFLNCDTYDPLAMTEGRRRRTRLSPR
jgi:hypothetical protein